MAFVVKGTYIKNRQPTTGTLEWHDGVLEGDPELVRRLIQLAEFREGTEVAFPECTGTISRHLENGLSTLALLHELLEPGFKAYGQVPQVPPDRQGA